MITKNNFYGELHGRTADSFLGCMDRKIKDVNERIRAVNEELCPNGVEHDFWIDVFDQPESGKGSINLLLNSSDTQYSESNVANALNALGSYILEAAEKEKEDVYTIYTDHRLFKEATRHLSYDKMSSCGTEMGDPSLENRMLFYKESKNYLKQVVQSINEDDYSKEVLGEILSSYKDYFDSIKLKRDMVRSLKDLPKHEIEEVEEAYKNSNLGDVNFEINGAKISNFKDSPSEFIKKERRHLSRFNNQLRLVKGDMIETKDSLLGTIRLKRITAMQPVSSDLKDFEFDYWDIENIKLLSKISNPKHEQVIKLVEEFSNAYKKVSEVISERDIEIFETMRSEADMCLKSNEFGISLQSAYRAASRVLTLIQREMIESYELDYYYTEIVKADWKQCSKCGESYPRNQYYWNKEKRGKDGFRVECKKCEQKRKKSS